MKRIWMFHLLNDYSGSPLVLKNSILALTDKHDITLCTSKSEGFLSNLEVEEKFCDYKWSPNKLFTLVKFVMINLRWFFWVLFNRKNIDLVYINTLLPFGAAVAAKIVNIDVLYHMHEPQVNPPALFSFLLSCAKFSASKMIFVSEYLKSYFNDFDDTRFRFAGSSGCNECYQSEQWRKRKDGRKRIHKASAPDSHPLSRSSFLSISLLVVESKHLAAADHPSRFQDSRGEVVCLWVPQAVASYANRLALLFREGHLDNKLIPFVSQILHSLKHEGANFFA